ncbi:MAG: TIGR02147 family protein [Oligoflexales bacterium]|nr:TIGR02147 family protein [Oligoflexales bacterium]
MLFLHKSYKDFIKEKISGYSNIKGYQGKLAVVAKCHPTFLSQVLNGLVHLTPEQAFHLTEFWELSEVEAEYFTLLLQYERSGSLTHRRWLERRLEKLRQANHSVSKVRERGTSLSIEEQQRYYSSWIMTAVHVAVSIPELNTIAKLSERLNLPSTIVELTIKELTEQGIISPSKKGGWIVNRMNLHLPQNSPLTWMNHNMWRQYAMQKLCTEHEKNTHYTAVMSMSRSDFDVLSHKILTLIQETVKQTELSKEEEVYVFLADCFIL